MTGYYAHYYVSFIFVPLVGVILPIATMGLLLNYIEN
ncbi:photosystem I reaction center subunit VIII [Pseudanabaena mucicola]|uniref:Photosystem I reaction center subunit VIII n=1 Tax=Pseudanabaena mucicola FACHB-723 TaxID=2692860 RepID=A0ABR7ZY48_9CYAN|nr:photosystem I reaction center subunit VIII [Pseudanabaena mucicola]MBD2188749.1 photosystem I reaction center subunit VIII [Pseudanabaena mucicola FACHB-723]